MEENRKGPGIFYAVVGVATLVVAIIGATFAYFSATVDPNTNTVAGTTLASSNVALSVTPIYPEASEKQGKSGRMVPLDDADLTKALDNKCLDKDGYVACQVYKVTLTNSGTDAVYANATLTLSVGTISSMKWQRMTDQNTTTGNAVTDVGTATLISTNPTEELAATNGTKDLYFVVWLSNQSTDQSTTDAGQTFTGTVAANITNASGTASTQIKATFSA